MSYKYCPPPLVEAYSDCDLHRQCPNCGAPPDDWCRRPDGTPRPIPCLRRYPPRPKAIPRTNTKDRAHRRNHAGAL